MKQSLAFLLFFPLWLFDHRLPINTATLIQAEQDTSNSLQEQEGVFNFVLKTSSRTSAGVFLDDSILVKTLWNNVKYPAGNISGSWDGRDATGILVKDAGPRYSVKIVSNNVRYQWQGTIGNTSTASTGDSRHHSYNFAMTGLTFAGEYGYFCNGYAEGTPSIAKFSVKDPNKRINIATAGNADHNYVATDGRNVYWAAFDSNNPQYQFVYATTVKDDKEIPFATGTNFTPRYSAKSYRAISYSDVKNTPITGLAVQKSGSFLFVSRKNRNEVQVINKLSGALVNTLECSKAAAICVDRQDNVWICSNENKVVRYRVTGEGKLVLTGDTLKQVEQALALQVSNDGKTLVVADGGSSQQLKFYSTTSGVLTETIGSKGGYLIDATVTDSKFYFSDINHTIDRATGLYAFIAFQPDNSYWVNDPGNKRVQLFNRQHVLINRIMSLGAEYSVYVDPNNINRVLAGPLEFSVDYTVQQPMGSKGWKLVKNWGATVPRSKYDLFQFSKHFTTLSNGRTYAFCRTKNVLEILEFPAKGTLRFSGKVLHDLAAVLCRDGSYQSYNNIGRLVTLQRFPLKEFDEEGNPIWDRQYESLAVMTKEEIDHSPLAIPLCQAYSATKVVFFHPGIYANQKDNIYHKGMHLGILSRGATNKYLATTEQSTHRNYEGNFPAPGWFDIGNQVNNYAGSMANLVDRHVITAYHGEFWKNGQTNMFNHYYDNGLAIGQFGTTSDQAIGRAFPGMAGNALSPLVVKDKLGAMYLYHGDESHHSAFHRWKITGLETITEQQVPLQFKMRTTPPMDGEVNLMDGIPVNGIFPEKSSGWTRHPVPEDTQDIYKHAWSVKAGKLGYLPNDRDIVVMGNFINQGTGSVERTLGTNNVATEWRVSGEITFRYNMNGDRNQSYFQVTDNKGAILVRLYTSATYPHPGYLYANTKAIATGVGLTKEISQVLPFEIRVSKGIVYVKYGQYPLVSTPIFNNAGNWRKPATLQLLFSSDSNGGYGQLLGVKNLVFRKDR